MRAAGVCARRSTSRTAVSRTSSFADPLVAYIHVRNTDVGCFLLQLDREHPDAALR